MDKFLVMECKLREIKIKLAKLKACAAYLLTAEVTRQKAKNKKDEKVVKQ